ncbi:hypothetical protein TorRG33x02_357490, partial [Trema orientale]
LAASMLSLPHLSRLSLRPPELKLVAPSSSLGHKSSQ